MDPPFALIGDFSGLSMDRQCPSPSAVTAAVLQGGSDLWFLKFRAYILTESIFKFIKAALHGLQARKRNYILQDSLYIQQSNAI